MVEKPKRTAWWVYLAVAGMMVVAYLGSCPGSLLVWRVWANILNISELSGYTVTEEQFNYLVIVGPLICIVVSLLIILILFLRIIFYKATIGIGEKLFSILFFILAGILILQGIVSPFLWIFAFI